VTEQTLHEQLKELYARETGEIESTMGDYRVDVVRGDLLIEIQTRSFSSIRDKLRDLTQENRVRLVHPIAYQKWITRLDEDKKQVSRRKSPRRGRVEDVFSELVYLPKLLMSPNFELEVVLVDLEEYWIDDGRGSWRRRRWSIHDKKMLELRERYLFKSPENFKQLIPEALPKEFTSRMLSKETGLNMRLAQKMLYCLTKMNIVERNGKKGRAYLYSIC
jgi:ribosomal protein S25